MLVSAAARGCGSVVAFLRCCSLRGFSEKNSTVSTSTKPELVSQDLILLHLAGVLPAYALYIKVQMTLIIDHMHDATMSCFV